MFTQILVWKHNTIVMKRQPISNLLWLRPPKLMPQLVSLLSFLFLTIHLNAQTVTGQVFDDQGLEAIGANVIVKGTEVGTTTDMNGEFSINVPTGFNVLEISYIGFTNQTVELDGRTNLVVRMSSDTELLDEIVVVGYGIQRKSDLTGSVASLNAKDISNVIAGNPTSALQGKLAGIQVENNGGAPGGEANVFVRGIGSLTNSYPLYVIDGTFADNMNFINPKDIESIEVLKDGASAAIYGSRAANGVVIITTKRGSDNGQIKVNLDLRTGTESPSKMLDLLNGPEFLDYRKQLEANDNSGHVFNGTFADTDWQDLSLNPGAINDHGLSVSGGTENARYFLSGNYFKQDGILVGSGYDRLNGRANSEFKIGRLTINQSLSLAQTNTQNNNWFGFDGTTAPILSENVPDNDGGFEAPDADIHGFGGSNKYGQAVLEDNNNKLLNLLGNVNFQYNILDDLAIKLNFGADYVNGYARAFTPTYFMSIFTFRIFQTMKHR